MSYRELPKGWLKNKSVRLDYSFHFLISNFHYILLKSQFQGVKQRSDSTRKNSNWGTSTGCLGLSLTHFSYEKGKRKKPTKYPWSFYITKCPWAVMISANTLVDSLNRFSSEFLHIKNTSYIHVIAAITLVFAEASIVTLLKTLNLSSKFLFFYKNY